MKGPLSSKQKSCIEEKVEHNINKTVHCKYVIMKVRQKISFMAFYKNDTVIEFFYK